MDVDYVLLHAMCCLNQGAGEVANMMMRDPMMIDNQGAFVARVRHHVAIAMSLIDRYERNEDAQANNL